MPPLALTDDEYRAVQAAAAPVHPLQRSAFLKALAGTHPRSGGTVILNGEAIPSSAPASFTAWPRICRSVSASRRMRKRRTRPSRVSGRARRPAELLRLAPGAPFAMRLQAFRGFGEVHVAVDQHR